MDPCTDRVDVNIVKTIYLYTGYEIYLSCKEKVNNLDGRQENFISLKFDNSFTLIFSYDRHNNNTYMT